MAGSVGVLTLAAILREKSLKPAVVNLDCLYLEFLGSDKDKVPNDFFQFITQRLALQSFDVFGFSSICSSYPLTLRLAQQVKNLFPNAQVVLGGPQASVVDQTTMRAFPCIDFVLRGEADETFADLLRVLASRRESSALEQIRGLTFRRDNEVVRNHNAKVVENLDVLPLPAFDLDPDLKRRGSIYLELGRGCPFACTFCSTNDFFRRNFRLKSPWKMIREMEQVKAETGIANFSLIHDMFTVDRKRVVAFCDALLACKDRFTWACSARTDCVDDALIERMANAGCRGIFFGIETGSERLQRKIRKDLDLEQAMQRIECADRLGIKTAVALITAFPDETYEDLRDTIHFFVDSSRFDHAEPQLSLLAPLAGTALHDAYKDELILDCVFSDMSHQGWQQDPADLEMIKRYPDVFPNFYAIPTSSVPRRYFKEVRDFVAFLTSWFRWLPVALLQDSG
ncbi:MAG: radical SAM protein, partial [Bryobacteraceae bacterium]